VSHSTSQHEQELQAKLSVASERLAILERQLHALDVKLSSYLTQQARYDLLEESYLSLEKLNKLGSEDFFRDATGHELEQQLIRTQLFISAFKKNTVALENARSELKAKIQTQQDAVHSLTKSLQALHKNTNRQEDVPGVMQQLRDMPYRILPWTTQGSDELRFQKMLVMLLLPAILFGAAIPYFKPPVEKSMGVVVPQRIAKLIKKNQKIKQVEQQRQEHAAKKAAEQDANAAKESVDAPLPKASLQSSETAVASSGRAVDSKGVLAFKSDLASLLDDSSLPKMGSDAQITVNKAASSGDSSSALIVSQGSGDGGAGSSKILQQTERGSGGIRATGPKRKIGGVGTGQRIAENGIKISQVESAVISVTPNRTLSKGDATRTDEEIQVVFDRHKSALYRMYNRELRTNPSLRGNMVLKIVIQPDGSVSECTLKSNDLDSATFTSSIVKRVLRFNFGAKPAVSAMTILYPIEFVPPN